MMSISDKLFPTVSSLPKSSATSLQLWAYPEALGTVPAPEQLQCLCTLRCGWQKESTGTARAAPGASSSPLQDLGAFVRAWEERGTRCLNPARQSGATVGAGSSARSSQGRWAMLRVPGCAHCAPVSNCTELSRPEPFPARLIEIQSTDQIIGSSPKKRGFGLMCHKSVWSLQTAHQIRTSTRTNQSGKPAAL